MSSLFSAWKRLFDRPTGAPQPHAEEIRSWQKTVVEEQESLREELELLLRTYVRTVDRFVEHANQLTEEQFTQEQEAIESIRKILQNAIRRLEVSSKDHRELLDEWHEWVAFRRAAGERHELEPAHQLRVEMIRSELTVRGIQVEEPTKKQRSSEAQEQPVTPTVEQAVTSTIQIPVRRETQPVLDDLADWHAIRQEQILPEWQEAERAWSEVAHKAHLYPEHAAQALKRLKEAHAELKLLDRSRREKRYRLHVFEV